MILDLADDALILSHRCSEWLTRSPEIELDIAFGNIGLDLLGQARSLYALVGDEDQLAYHRDTHEWRSCTLVELPNGDFAFSMMRLLAFATYECALFNTDPGRDDVRAIYVKAIKEATYHFEHAEAWVLRLGDGTDVSHERMQHAADTVWPLITELCSAKPAIEAGVRATLAEVLATATLTVPTATASTRRRERTPHLADLLHEMQALAREHEGATW